MVAVTTLSAPIDSKIPKPLRHSNLRHCNRDAKNFAFSILKTFSFFFISFFANGLLTAIPSKNERLARGLDSGCGGQVQRGVALRMELSHWFCYPNPKPNSLHWQNTRPVNFFTLSIKTISIPQPLGHDPQGYLPVK